LIAVALVGALAVVGCGGDSNVTIANVTVTGSQQPSAATAAEIIPKLDDLGLTLVQQGKPAAVTSSQDAAIAQYQKTSAPAMLARVEVSVLPDVPTATTTFGTLSEALRNIPPDLFGVAATQIDNTSTGIGDQSRAFITAKPDGQGNYVFTDSYRFGRTFVITYLVAKNPDDALKTRKAIAEKVKARAP
jgi:hypothetical protein